MNNDDRRGDFPRDITVAQKLLAAMVTEFASLTKDYIDSAAAHYEKHGIENMRVALPKLYWEAFDGSVSEALQQVQTHGFTQFESADLRAESQWLSTPISKHSWN